MHLKYLVPLPIPNNQVANGEAYTKYIMDSDIINSETEDTIHLKYNHFTEHTENYHKTYHLNRWLSQFLNTQTFGCTLVVDVEENIKRNTFHNQTIVWSNNFERFRMVINKYISTDSNPRDFVSETIDVITNRSKKFTDQSKKIEKLWEEYYGIKSTQNWTQNTNEKDMSYLIIEVDLKLEYDQGNKTLEKYIIEDFKSYITLYYETQLLLYPKWKGLAVSEQRSLTIGNFKNAQRKSTFSKRQEFSSRINNFTNLYELTGFKNLKMAHQENNLYESNQADGGLENYEALTKMADNKTSGRVGGRHRGFILKRGDGPINFDWNERQLVVDGQTLFYYHKEEDQQPRQTLQLNGARVLDLIPDGYNASVKWGFVVEFSPEKKLHFSGKTEIDNIEWRDFITDACTIGFGDDKNDEKMDDGYNLIEIGANAQGYDETDYSFINDFLENMGSSEWKLTKLNNGIRVFRYGYQEEVEKEKANKGIFGKLLSQIKQSGISFKRLEVLKIQFNKNIKNKVLIAAAFLMVIYLFMDLFYRLIFLWGVISVLLMLFNDTKSINKAIAYILGNKKNKHERSKLQRCQTMGKIALKASHSEVLKYIQDQSNIDKWHINLNSIKPQKTSGSSVLFSATNVLAPINGSRYFQIEGSSKLIRAKEFIILAITTTGKLSCGEFGTNEVILLERYPENYRRSVLTYWCNIFTEKGFIRDLKSLWKEGDNKVNCLNLLREQVEDRYVLGVTNIEELQQKRKMYDPETNFSLDALKFAPRIDVSDKQNLFDQGYKIFENIIGGHIDHVRMHNLEQREPGYSIDKKGVVECHSIEEIKAQEGLVSDLMGQSATALFTGRGIVGISLPVRIFEPVSLLEREARYWSFVPYYQKKAASVTDKLERFKLVTMIGLSGCVVNVRQKKPFNPHLGETFQGYFSDGTTVDMEYTTHHPPISSFYMVDANKKWKLHGHHEFKVKIGWTGNWGIGSGEGPNVVEFHDGQTIAYSHPGAKIQGFIFGTRSVEMSGEYWVEDKQNNFYFKADFGNGKGENAGRVDSIEGDIVKFTNPSSKIAHLKGRWTEQITIDDHVYFDYTRMNPLEVHPVKNPLPSDSKYRKDRFLLKKGDLDRAAEEKVKGEVLMRKDRAIRADYKEKQTKK